MKSSVNSVATKPHPKKNRTRKKEYIDWIRTLGCCVCGLSGFTDPHHVNRDGHGGTGLKADDTRCIPLCHKHHTEYHQIGKKTFQQKHNIQYEYLIGGLKNRYVETFKHAKNQHG